jgi:hypothetical protein
MADLFGYLTQRTVQKVEVLLRLNLKSMFGGEQSSCQALFKFW